MSEHVDATSEPEGRRAPGEKLRFFVADNQGRRGSSWAVETSRKSNDVYLFHREGSKWVKASFHESGQWHFSVMHAGRQALSDGQTPYLGVVHHRAPVAAGWWHGAQIVVPHSELRSTVEPRLGLKGAVRIPPAPGHNAVAIDLLVADPHHARIRVDEAFLIGSLARMNGGMAVCVARGLRLSAPIHEVFDPQIAEARSALAASSHEPKSPTRIVIFGNEAESGFLWQVEVALDPGTSQPLSR